MQVTKTALDGVLILEPKVFGDARGWQIKSMIIGYSFGFISGVGVMIVRELFFK